MQTIEVERYREQLLELRNRTGDELREMIRELLVGEPAVGEHDPYPSESPERGFILEHNEEEIHRRLNEALERIDAGTFGKCLRCGREIPRVRLQAIAYAEHCMPCERELESR